MARSAGTSRQDNLGMISRVSRNARMAAFPVLGAANRGHSCPSGCGCRLLDKARLPPKLKRRANDQQNLVSQMPRAKNDFLPHL